MSLTNHKLTTTHKALCGMKPLLLVLVSTLGCGPQNRYKNNPDHIYDSKMTTYIEMFKTDAAAHGVTVNLDGLNYANVVDQAAWDEIATQANISSDVEGFCEASNIDNERKVGAFGRTLYKSHDQTFTAAITVLAQPDQPFLEQMTAFHELGHCVLGLEHSTSENTIMSEFLPTEDYLRAHLAELLKQFFGSR